MGRQTIFFSFLLLCMVLEPAFANKFETIGGGVSGLSREKIELMKQISLYAGGFFLFLGVVMLLTRNRFEGFVGLASDKGMGIAYKGAVINAVIGLLLVGISYL